MSSNDPRLSRFGNERVGQLAEERAGDPPDRRDIRMAEDYAAIGAFGILLALFMWYVDLPWFLVPNSVALVFAALGLFSLSAASWMLTDGIGGSDGDD